ncbi:hypothetical protein [Aliamphritea spongicola]|nr:hypothetical protein [Aliamphritea spongicola]
MRIRQSKQRPWLVAGIVAAAFTAAGLQAAEDDSRQLTPLKTDPAKAALGKRLF